MGVAQSRGKRVPYKEKRVGERVLFARGERLRQLYEAVLSGHQKLKWLYLFVFINAIGNVLFIFVPLYLYNDLHFPIWLALAPIFTANLGYGLFGYFGYKIQERIGTRNFYLVFYFLCLLHRSMLFFITKYPGIIWAYLATEPLLGLFSDNQPYKVYLARYVTKKHRGSLFGIILVVALLGAALAATADTLLLSFYGFNALLLFTILFMMLEIVPILQLDNFFEPKTKWEYWEAVRIMFSSRFRKTFVAQMALGVLATGSSLWPFFIYLSLNSYGTTGAVISIALFFQVAFFLLIGHFTDLFGRITMLWAGAVLNSFIWFGRGIVGLLPTSILLFIGLEAYTKFAEATMTLPYDSSLYDKVDSDISYVALFDFMSHTGTIPSFLLVLLALYFFPLLQSFLFVYFILCGFLIFLLPQICNGEV